MYISVCILQCEVNIKLVCIVCLKIISRIKSNLYWDKSYRLTLPSTLILYKTLYSKPVHRNCDLGCIQVSKAFILKKTHNSTSIWLDYFHLIVLSAVGEVCTVKLKYVGKYSFFTFLFYILYIYSFGKT